MNRLRSMVDSLSSPRLALAAFAFAAMGAWALFANATYAIEVGLRAGLGQGALSALFALTQRSVLIALGFAAPRWIVLVAPPVIISSGFIAILILAHLVLATPEVGLTIAAPAGFALAASALANWRLRRGG